jgi:transposase
MPGTMTYVGFDVHARSTHATAIDVMTGELSRVRFGPGVETPVDWLKTLSGPVRACYEAGPTGYGLYRAAAAAGIGMEVIAPGLTPRGRGDRIKTDRKDAELLARCLIAGSLTAVVVPPPAVEAAREVVRAHDACRRDLMNARHRVSKMLLRHGRVYPEPSTWTQKHRRWLAAQQFPEPMSAFTYADLVATVDGLTARKKTLAERIGELATDEQWWATVARLRAFRGVDTLTALAIHLELGADWTRFEKPTRVGSWLGLTPSRSQSGESDRHGSITKTGSMLARRLLVESAWQYIREPRIGATLANRQEGQPDHILQISNRAQQRLHHLYTSMRARGKPHNVTVVAVARELSCFLWAAATAP